ncbi:MAG: glycosyltransferase [Saprospiraceae bacterium]|nr:glycosyltransferase [Saprospiraceae bacterium]MBK8078864.1 glycosyltransferase [Saprospiraceae bacterium]MBK9042463.1 glycosyltransferase [Saprospiraceae bacterium]MBP6693531.1 glycosyltransferase [Saprospiraceae bacterium]
MADISVIIPSLNERLNLLKRVPFLLDLKNVFEILIVEAGETNEKFVFDDSRVRILQTEKTGRAIQMNIGAAMAKGKILCFLHADVVPHTDSFEAIKKRYQENFKFGFFSYRFSPESFLLKINAFFTKKDGLFSGGGDQIQWIEKELFQQMGGFDETFVIMEDFELTSRIKNNKVPYCIIDLPATVSSRKYKSNSYVRVNFTNLIAFGLFLCRVDPLVIKRWCDFMLK